MGSRDRSRDLSQFGLFNMPDDIEDDGSLENELNSLMGGGSKKPKSKGKAKTVVSPAEFDAMVSACLADPSKDVDVDLEGDDADLLNELDDMFSDEEEEEMNPPNPPASSEIYTKSNLLSILESRISMYSSAKNAAESSGNSSHARRYGRALDQMKDSRRRIQSGRAVNEDDLPPPLTEKQIAAYAPKRDSPPPHHQEQETTPDRPTVAPQQPKEPIIKAPPTNAPTDLAELKAKRDHYKREALAAKARGDRSAAMEGLRGVKAIDELIKKNAGGSSTAPSPKQQEPSELAFDKNKPLVLPENIEEIPPADPSVFGAPPPPKTVLEGLSQRLEYYEKEEIKAKNSENASKARRIGRVCKQYKDAIKATKGGKTFDAENLPCPLGYAPIPTAATTVNTKPAAPKPAVAPSPPKAASSSHSIQEKQLKILLERQALFKAAALEAKKAGQMSQAKEYLRQCHGFENLIEASRGGLPVDLNSTPVPPQQMAASGASEPDLDFVIVSRQDSLDEGKSRQEMFQKLEEELLAQIKMCESNRAYFKSTGDIPSSNKFMQMEAHTKKDLQALRHAYKLGSSVPSFHYEVRSFSRVVCNTDLTDNEVELQILAGNNYKGDKTIDTYVTYEFPYPKEDPFKGETQKVKDSDCPNYEHSISIPINMREKSCQRIFKRHAVKCEVWVDRGFFRKDVLLGSVSAKLTPLEKQASLHDCFPLMDGRKAVGGTLEVMVRLRNPVLAKQVEKTQEKWLVISF